MIKSSILLLALTVSGAVVAQSQNRMNQMTDAQWKAADALMTRQWRAVYAQMNRLDAQDTSRGGGFGYAPTALESQRAWLSYRDRQCAIEAGEYAGGSMESMTHNQCLARLTRERTIQLGKLIWRGR